MINGQRTLRPTVVSMYNYMQPLVAVVVSVTLGLAVFTPTHALAVALIFSGVWLVAISRLEAKRLRVILPSPREALRRRACKYKKLAPTSSGRMWGLTFIFLRNSAEDYLRRLAGAFFVVVFLSRLCSRLFDCSGSSLCDGEVKPLKETSEVRQRSTIYVERASFDSIVLVVHLSW